MIRVLAVLGRALALVVLLNGVGALDLEVRGVVQQARNPALEPVMQTVTNVAQPRNLFGLMVVVAAFGGAIWEIF